VVSVGCGSRVGGGGDYGASRRGLPTRILLVLFSVFCQALFLWPFGYQVCPRFSALYPLVCNSFASFSLMNDRAPITFFFKKRHACSSELEPYVGMYKGCTCPGSAKLQLPSSTNLLLFFLCFSPSGLDSSKNRVRHGLFQRIFKKMMVQ
jgi:hypothetical protein